MLGLRSTASAMRWACGVAGRWRGCRGRGRGVRVGHPAAGTGAQLATHLPAVLVPACAVGPFSNPSETYQYYDLPFCAPPEKDNKLLTLGEVGRGGGRGAGVGPWGRAALSLGTIVWRARAPRYCSSAAGTQ